MKYDLLVFIGRFAPLHAGHHDVIDRARSLAKNVLVLVGSAGVARSTRNPFTYEERRQLIDSVYSGNDVVVRPIHDHTYNDAAWILEVQQQVADVVKELHLYQPKIGLIGCDKDHTSYYLKLFPDWGNESVHFNAPLNATEFRKELFTNDLKELWEQTNLAPSTYRFLKEFTETPEYAVLKYNYDFEVNYKKEYGKGPFLTADSLVQVGGKVLLIQRGKEYGSGLWALPGGFVNDEETFRNAAIRELREETRIRVPEPVLRGSVRSSATFDSPHRSLRARLVTQCYHIHLANDTSLPEVRGSDDAENAEFRGLAWILENEELFFEDHFHIIKSMLGVS